MRRILLGACCAFAACGPAAAPPSSGPAGRPTEVMTTGDAINVAMTSEVRVVTQTVDAPVDRVWAVLPAVYAELGLEGGADAARRTMSGTGNFSRRFQGQAAARLFDCGQGQFGTPLANTSNIRFAISTTVNPADNGGSRLDSQVEAHARSTDGANSLAAQCRTEGQLEAMIVERVRAKLAG